MCRGGVCVVNAAESAFRYCAIGPWLRGRGDLLGGLPAKKPAPCQWFRPISSAVLSGVMFWDRLWRTHMSLVPRESHPRDLTQYVSVLIPHTMGNLEKAMHLGFEDQRYTVLSFACMITCQGSDKATRKEYQGHVYDWKSCLYLM